ncbi:DUF2599 domain-containing protein [Luteococcus sp. OSA5]|uniref:DUF2599 domain-containing protein n=1 Tax=Luteococcus sp. OSA5 TaxID=3401630 RepID=UPI003B4363FF
MARPVGVTVVVALGLAAGCSGSPAPQPATTVGSSPAASAQPRTTSTPSTSNTPGTTERTGATVPPPSGPATPLPTQNTTLQLTGTQLHLALANSDQVSVEGGALVVRRKSGQLRLIVTAPTLTTPGQSPASGSWRVEGQRIVAVPSQEATPAARTAVQTRALMGTDLVAEVRRESWQSEPRWLVHPTRLGRATPVSLWRTDGWTQARRKGQIPASRSLQNQLVCHPASGVARSKPSWNIEAARDASDFIATMAAGCNP